MASKRRRKRKAFVVSVRDFGAQGDGFTDDTHAFESARKSKAHVILVPPGVYEIKVEVEIDHRFVSTERRKER